eukprot:6473412-Amphidinium_carterae.3
MHNKSQVEDFLRLPLETPVPSFGAYRNLERNLLISQSLPLKLNGKLPTAFQHYQNNPERKQLLRSEHATAQHLQAAATPPGLKG